MNDNKIREGLLQAGWPLNEVNEAFLRSEPMVIPKTKEKLLMPKLLAIVFALIFVGALGYLGLAYYFTNYQNLPMWPLGAVLQ